MCDERELIEKLKKQDFKAQKLLYKKYCSKFLGICMRFAKNKHEAEDILQDSFIKIYKKISQFNFEGSFEGWMKRIIINTAISYYRKNHKWYNVEINDSIINEEQSNFSFNIDDYELTTEEILKVIQSLSPGYRIVFNLYAIEGYSHKEIAEMLNINISTSKSQYSRAKKILQIRLQQIIQKKASLRQV
ncbi:MAG: sigma-70 family RNA polymerase sigma factor [Bacteroidales bacterium]|nr:sigma-70 family RNA polymerase sigma factor [Bacteroidales bacterium]